MPLPYPEAEVAEDEPLVTGLCGVLLSTALERSGLGDKAWRLTEEERRCLAMRLYMVCTEEIRFNATKEEERLRKAAEKAQVTAFTYKQRDCRGAANTDAVQEIINSIRHNWDEWAKVE